MLRPRWLLALCLALACSRADRDDSAPTAPSPEHPNVVLIVLDDLALADLGAYGNTEIATPNIDRISREGMRFSHYYASSPVCSPTRAAILTGLEPAHFGFRRILMRQTRRGIPEGVRTIAHLLRDAGYQTAHVGKWHLGERRPEFLPRQKGFDYSLRKVLSPGVGNDLYTHYDLVDGDEVSQRIEGTRHLTEALTDESLRLLRKMGTREPFFLNLWYLAPHTPLSVPADFDNEATRYDLKSRRGRYAALVTNVDRQIGRILEYLDEAGLVSRTLLLITSDNGGAGHLHSERELRGAKTTLLEGGLRVPLLARWPGAIPADSVSSSLVSSIDFLPTLAELVGTEAEGDEAHGESFLAAFAGNAVRRSRPLFFEAKRSRSFFEESRSRYVSFAVRDHDRNHDWKLIFGSTLAQDETAQLFDLGVDPGERRDLATQHPEVVTRMRAAYEDWRRDIGTIDATLRLSGDEVAREGSDLIFAGAGWARLGPDTRFDFHDGDFSFEIEVEALAREDGELQQSREVVASRAPGWTLALEANRFEFRLRSEDAESVVLKSPPIERGTRHHLAFTVFSWKKSPSTVQLYLDGEVVDQSLQAVGPIQSSDALITLGNSANRDAPFSGRLSIPKSSTLCFEPDQIRRAYLQRKRNRLRQAEASR